MTKNFARRLIPARFSVSWRAKIGDKEFVMAVGARRNTPTVSAFKAVRDRNSLGGRDPTSPAECYPA